jgi:hypothetical protein
MNATAVKNAPGHTSRHAISASGTNLYIKPTSNVISAITTIASRAPMSTPAPRNGNTCASEVET